MDAIVFLLVRGKQNWVMETFEAAQASRLREIGVEPIAYRWNKHISLLPHPTPQELSSFISDPNQEWKCYVIDGDFLSKLEEEINGWVDEFDAANTGLDELIDGIFTAAPDSILAFEPQGEAVDSVYEEKEPQWIYQKIRNALDRQEKLEGFVVIGKKAS